MKVGDVNVGLSLIRGKSNLAVVTLNVIDDKECSFILPSIISTGPLSISWRVNNGDFVSSGLTTLLSHLKLSYLMPSKISLDGGLVHIRANNFFQQNIAV